MPSWVVTRRTGRRRALVSHFPPSAPRPRVLRLWLVGFRYVHVIVQDEELLAVVLHDVLAQVVDEVRDCHGAAMVVAGGNGQVVVALVREEHLQPAAETGTVLSARPNSLSLDIYCVSKQEIY